MSRPILMILHRGQTSPFEQDMFCVFKFSREMSIAVIWVYGYMGNVLKVWGLIPQMGTRQSAPISPGRDPEAYPLVPRWLLIIADINLFGVALLLDPQVLILWHRGASTSPTETYGSLWAHGRLLSPAAQCSHLGLGLRTRSPSGHSPHAGLRSRVLQRSSLPEVSAHQDLAEISPHHQNR